MVLVSQQKNIEKGQRLVALKPPSWRDLPAIGWDMGKWEMSNEMWSCRRRSG